MNTLLLLRHGKAVAESGSGDHSRSLNDRGRQQSTTIGSLLERLGLVPDLVLVSDAARTRETAALALPNLGTIVKTDARLYQASPDEILAVVREAAGSAKRVMVVGHNPGIGDLARSLEGAGDPQAVIGMQESFPTAALAVLDFSDCEWAAVDHGAATLTRFIVPEAAAST